jgi:hypothetical protein
VPGRPRLRLRAAWRFFGPDGMAKGKRNLTAEWRRHAHQTPAAAGPWNAELRLPHLQRGRGNLKRASPAEWRCRCREKEEEGEARAAEPRVRVRRGTGFPAPRPASVPCHPNLASRAGPGSCGRDDVHFNGVDRTFGIT